MKYRYNGTIYADTIDGKDIIFIDRGTYYLSEKNNKVIKMVKNGALTPVEKEKKQLTKQKGE